MEGHRLGSLRCTFQSSWMLDSEYRYAAGGFGLFLQNLLLETALLPATSWNATTVLPTQDIFSALDVHSGTLAFPTRFHLSSSQRERPASLHVCSDVLVAQVDQNTKRCWQKSWELWPTDHKALQPCTGAPKPRVGLDHMVAILLCVPGS